MDVNLDILWHTRLSAVEPGFESRPSYKLSTQCFTCRVINQYVCRPLEGRSTGRPVAHSPLSCGVIADTSQFVKDEGKTSLGGTDEKVGLMVTVNINTLVNHPR